MDRTNRTGGDVRRPNPQGANQVRGRRVRPTVARRAVWIVAHLAFGVGMPVSVVTRFGLPFL